MRENMKSFVVVVTVALVGQLAAASPFHPYHIQDLYEVTVEQIKFRLKPTPQQQSLHTKFEEPVVQPNAAWGLARISHRSGLDWRTFNKYVHDPQAGADVNVYILDSGIDIDHPDFEGRAIWGKNIVEDGKDEDADGHGTHYAGTVAGRTYGVSKKANVIAVKTFATGRPNVTSIIKGIEWTSIDHQLRRCNDETLKGGVIMLSDGGIPLSDELVAALDAAYEAGMHVAVSAGNGTGDACASAAGKTKGLVVSSTTNIDRIEPSSNTGSCVDLFAPGEYTRSDSRRSKETPEVMGGTGPAAAHAAGLLAYFISAADKGASSPDVIKKQLLDIALKGGVKDVPEGTVNVSQNLEL